MSATLPALVDCRTLMDELGVKRATAEALMRNVPAQAIPGSTKWVVRRKDVQALLDEGYLTDRQKALTYYHEKRLAS